MFKNTKFYALALLVTAASVSFASEAPEAVANPAPTELVENSAPVAPVSADVTDVAPDAAPKAPCKYNVFVKKHKYAFGAGTAAVVAIVFGFLYNKRAKNQTAAR